MTISAIPTTRVSDSFIRARLLSQLQGDQTGLVRLQTEITTGRRVISPSDDPQAASQAIGLQRLIEQKTQFQTNVKNTQAFLTATDTAISGVADLLRQIKGDALTVIGTTSSNEQRQAVANGIDAAIKQLVDVGNRQFNGRYIFAGSRSQQLPYGISGNSVTFGGNERDLRAFTDLDQIIASNVLGADVLGGLSPASYSPSEINTKLTLSTRLSDLNDGAGVDLGSIVVSDGTNSSTVNLSSAVTIGDVVRLLESSPPATRTVSVGVSSTGLSVSLDSGGGGNLTITESGSGQAAHQLGIYQAVGSGTGPLVGSDLDPRSPVDLNVAVTSSTRLVDLNGGSGVQLGSLQISDGLQAPVTIDLSGADTLGDVQDLIEANAPPGRFLTARLTHDGLTVVLDSAGGGNLTITEAAGGSTAADLGIYTPTGAGTGPVGGGDINPSISLTTKLGSLLGAKATAVVPSGGNDNDILFTTAATGNGSNGIRINYVDDGSVAAAGQETVFYDSGTRVMIVRIKSGVSTANDVVSAVHAQASSLVTASLDRGDLENDGTGVILATSVDPNATGLTSGGRGEQLDLSSGVQIVNGGQTHTISLASLNSNSTFNDLLNAFNLSDAGVVADISPDGQGLRLRSSLSGGDFTVGENGGRTATQLGIRSFTYDTRLDSLNFGRGVHDATGADLVIQRKDGTRLSIDIGTATSIGDVIDAINRAPGNTIPPGTSTNIVTARLAASGNGIELVTNDTATTATFRVERAGGSFAAIDLGLVPEGQDHSDPATVSGSVSTLTGADTGAQETSGVFTALYRLRDALRANDDRAIERSAGLLDNAIVDVNYARASLGAQQQSLDTLKTRLDNEDVELQSVLSDNIDADLAESISEFAARQSSYQAALQVTAQIAQLTLLNYL